MKKFKDIENLRLDDVELNGHVTRKNNISAFELGDELVIQEKIDGSCASFHYLGDGKFDAYSRRKKLTPEENLNGFYQYCEKIAERLHKMENVCRETVKQHNLTDKDFKSIFDYSDYIFFGEWTGARNKIVYKTSPMKEGFVFDAYMPETQSYVHQNILDLLCEELELTKVKTLAYIPSFKGWETVLPFANPKYSFYGNTQEGIVVKNQSKLEVDKELREPVYIKIVNEAFKETQKVKQVDPEKEKALKNAQDLLAGVVTNNRVSKVLGKLQEDGEVPKELTPDDLGKVAKKLPKAVFEDVKKEEPEIVEAAGKFAGKVSGSYTMAIAREIIGA